MQNALLGKYLTKYTWMENILVAVVRLISIMLRRHVINGVNYKFREKSRRDRMLRSIFKFKDLHTQSDKLRPYQKN